MHLLSEQLDSALMREKAVMYSCALGFTEQAASCTNILLMMWTWCAAVINSINNVIFNSTLCSRVLLCFLFQVNPNVPQINDIYSHFIIFFHLEDKQAHLSALWVKQAAEPCYYFCFLTLFNAARIKSFPTNFRKKCERETCQVTYSSPRTQWCQKVTF